MDDFSRKFFAVLILLSLISVGVTFYRTVVEKDIVIVNAHN